MIAARMNLRRSPGGVAAALSKNHRGAASAAAVARAYSSQTLSRRPLRRAPPSSTLLASCRRPRSSSPRSVTATATISHTAVPRHPSIGAARHFSSDDSDDGEEDETDTENPLEAERESMPFDVLIVGGGPAGLAAAIRLRQLCDDSGKELSVCVVEKGSEIGAHILSGNVFDPRALEELLPDVDWITELAEFNASIATPVTHDTFLALTPTSSMKIPNLLLPSQLHNDGNYIISLGQLCRYLGAKAEEMGVEIYPGFAASEVLYDDEEGTSVVGVATRDVGIGKDGKPKSTYERGVSLLARQTLFAEGARGSCTESLISKFNLRANSPSSHQSYGLGIKEVWEIPAEHHRPGLVQHTLGYPLQSTPFDKTYGGTFLYHQAPNLILCGLVVGLNYANPYLNPYKEFQRWKTHPDISPHFEGGTCISYGARVLNEGGLHALPALTFKGGALLGCAAGFLNVVKIKGSHLALKSGSVAAEAVFEALTTSASGESASVESVANSGEIDPTEAPIEAVAYQSNMDSSWVHDELHEVRNCHEAFSKWGVLPGLAYTGLVCHVLKGREPWTLSHNDGDEGNGGGTDADATGEASNYQPILYPPSDGVLTFDLLTNLQRSGTFHDDDQPSHLRIKADLADIPESVSMSVYAAPEQRFCPAGVYEYVEDSEGAGADEGEAKKQKLVINAQNCIHCKCCSIKMPHEYIDWTVPEGGGGPNYQGM